MPNFGKKGYYNPFYNSVDRETRTELETRASHYSAIQRSGVSDQVLEWSYRKIAYGRVTAGSKNGISMGFSGPNSMTDKSGNLTLYNSTRNVPIQPLLQSIDVTNDGTIGSLLRGKFNFVYWPALTRTHFDMGKIDDLFFVPGKEVKLSWGWSVQPGSRSRQSFTGIINNFNWSFNADHSINAEVSIVSAASLAIGISGDQTKVDTDPNSQQTDPAGVAMAGINIASIIDSDLASITGSMTVTTTGSMTVTTAGDVRYIGKDAAVNNNKIFDYYCIGWPYADENTSSSNVQAFWYTTVTRFVEVTNLLLDQFEKSGGGNGLGSIFELQVDGNTTSHLKNIKSSYPQDVIFPSEDMGSYGNVKPSAWSGNFTGFHPAKTYDSGSKSYTLSATGVDAKDRNLINIGGILISANYIKDTYKNFIQENAANIPYRNITKFIEDVLKRINVASGDMYQFAAVLCDDPDQMKPRGDFNNLDRTILSIEDTNLSPQHTTDVHAYRFDSNAIRPLIKNISITSKPPAPLAAAAFTKARNSRNANVDTPVSANKDDKEPDKTVEEMKKHLDSFSSNGFNDKWSETYRGLQSRLKKVSNPGDDAHWLTKAIYPVELSITLDGVSGFNFGNVVTTNLLPTEYVNAGMVFTVTKIDHKITPSVWETTLHTVCRLDADSKFGSPQ